MTRDLSSESAMLIKGKHKKTAFQFEEGRLDDSDAALVAAILQESRAQSIDGKRVINYCQFIGARKTPQGFIVTVKNLTYNRCLGF